MQMFKIKCKSCMILVSRYSKGYAILSSKEILLQETGKEKKKKVNLPTVQKDRFVFLGTSLLTHHE